MPLPDRNWSENPYSQSEPAISSGQRVARSRCRRSSTAAGENGNESFTMLIRMILPNANREGRVTSILELGQVLCFAMAVKRVIKGVHVVPMGKANAFVIEGDDGL